MGMKAAKADHFIHKWLASALAGFSLIVAAGYPTDSAAKDITAYGRRHFFAGPPHLGTPSMPANNGPAKTKAMENVTGVLVSNSNKVDVQTDFTTHTFAPVQLERTYNHNSLQAPTLAGLFGRGWTSNYDVNLSFVADYTLLCNKPVDLYDSDYPCYNAGGSITTIYATSSDGSVSAYDLNKSDGKYENASPDADDYFIRQSNGSYVRTYVNGTVSNYDIYGDLLSVTDTNGLVTSYTYDSKLLLKQVQFPGNQVVSFAYNNTDRTNAQLVMVTDPAGGHYGYSYSSKGYLTGVSDPNGITTTYYYELTQQLGTLTGIAVNEIRTRTYAYNNDGTVSSTTLFNPSGSSQYFFTYNSSTQTNTVTTPTGAVYTYNYQTIQGQPRLTKMVRSASGLPTSTYSWTYDVYGHPATYFDPRGVETTYSYSSNGLLLNKTTGISSSFPGQTRTTAYTWDSLNRQSNVATSGPSGAISSTAFNYYPSNVGRNRVQSVVVTNQSQNGTSGQTETTSYYYSFNSNNIPSEMVASGPLVSNNYYDAVFDASGNLTSSADINGRLTYGYGIYHLLGLPSTITDQNGYTVNYQYDPRGRLTSTSRNLDGTSATTSYSYDAFGNLNQITYPDGYVSYTFDYTGNVNSVTTSLSASSRISFSLSHDALGDLTSASIASPVHQGPGTQFYYHHGSEYDAYGRLVSSTGANGQSLSYTYDNNDNQISSTDTNGKTKKLTYNPYGQVLSSTDANGGITLISYDGAGNTASIQDPKGNVTNYYYDGFGKLSAQSNPDTGITTFQYDSFGRMTQSAAANGVATSYTYDALSRVTQISAANLNETFSYDNCTNGIGHLCSFIDAPTYGSSGSTAYTYRQNGQTASQATTVIGSTYNTSWTYDNRDRVASIIYPGGNIIGYSYDANSNVTGITATIAGVVRTVASNFAYAASGFGPRTNLTTGDSVSHIWSYDSDFRLIGLVNGGFTSHGYGYDAVNNLTSIADNLTPSYTENFNYDALHRLVSTSSQSWENASFQYDANSNRNYSAAYGTYTVDPSSNRLTGFGGYTFGYDPLGNHTSQSGNGSLQATYTYDAFNRMTAIGGIYGSSYYSYNALSQRAAKWGYPNTGGSYGYEFVYAPNGQLLMETPSGNPVPGTEYIWLDGQPIALIRNNALYFISNDHLGRPTVVTSTAGQQVWASLGRSFDEQVIQDNFGGLNLGFPGQYFDTEYGLWYNGARYYNSYMGGYMQSDPIGLGGGLNTYNYVLGSPVNLVDSDGTAPEPFEIFAGAVAGGIGGYTATHTRTGAVTGALVGGAIGAFDPFASKEAGSLGALLISKYANSYLSAFFGQALASGVSGKVPNIHVGQIAVIAGYSLTGSIAAKGFLNSDSQLSGLTADVFGEVLGGEADREEEESYVDQPPVNYPEAPVTIVPLIDDSDE